MHGAPDETNDARRLSRRQTLGVAKADLTLVFTDGAGESAVVKKKLRIPR